MFPDGELAKKYGAGSTKTSKIIKGKKRGYLKTPNCRPTSRKKVSLKFAELILLWSSLQDWGCCKNLNFFKNHSSQVQVNPKLCMNGKLCLQFISYL